MPGYDPVFPRQTFWTVLLTMTLYHILQRHGRQRVLFALSAPIKLQPDHEQECNGNVFQLQTLSRTFWHKLFGVRGIEKQSAWFVPHSIVRRQCCTYHCPHQSAGSTCDGRASAAWNVGKISANGCSSGSKGGAPGARPHYFRKRKEFLKIFIIC